MAGGIEKLTALDVKNAKEPGYYGDGGGLWLQLSKLGGKSWAFRFTIHGKRREMGLGPFHTVSLAKARLKAQELREQVRNGIDPIDRRKADRSDAAAAAAKEGKTFAHCVKAVLAAKAHEFRNPKTAKLWEARLRRYAYPKFETRIVGTITNDEVAAVLEPIWRTKYPTAKKLREYLEAVFSYAKAMKYREGDNPAAWDEGLEPILGKPNHKTKHYAALPYADVGAFVIELRKREALAARAVEFAILTAARSGEVRGAVWDEIDLTAKLWTIPAERMKGHKLHRVPLADDAVKLLQALPRVEGCALVFPASRGSKLSDMSLTAVLRRMGHDSTTVHGFRSSFKDWARNRTKYADEVSELALAHVNSDATRAAYARDELLDLRTPLMAAWGTYCNTPPKDEAGNVVPFERKAAQ